MKFISSLLVVKDIEASKKFYNNILNQDVIIDFGANVTLAGGFSLQTVETWSKFIGKDMDEIIYSNNAVELYFETTEFDEFISKLKNFNIKYVHPVIEHTWGQRGIRFYDLDNHIIEVSESLSQVAKRFIASGLNIEDTAKRMDIAEDYVKSLL